MKTHIQSAKIIEHEGDYFLIVQTSDEYIPTAVLLPDTVEKSEPGPQMGLNYWGGF